MTYEEHLQTYAERKARFIATLTGVATRASDETVAAEHAPLGVQLWPTTKPEAAPNFTLAEVTRYIAGGRERVRWTYESGATREFDLGDHVAVRMKLGLGFDAENNCQACGTHITETCTADCARMARYHAVMVRVRAQAFRPTLITY